MRQATVRHRAAIPDLDPQGRYHPHTLMRLGQEAVATVKRNAGVLPEMIQSARILEYQLTYHSPAGRDDELEVTAAVEEVTTTSVKFTFSVTTGHGTVATGVLSEVFDGSDIDASVAEHVRSALLDAQD